MAGSLETLLGWMKTPQRSRISRIALQIELALSDSVDLYRLCFVIFPRGGRLAPVDIWTLKAIMRALEPSKREYYLIVNQVDPDHDTLQFHTAFSNKLKVALADEEPYLEIPACQSEELLRATQQPRLVAVCLFYLWCFHIL